MDGWRCVIRNVTSELICKKIISNNSTPMRASQNPDFGLDDAVKDEPIPGWTTTTTTDEIRDTNKQILA